MNERLKGKGATDEPGDTDPPTPKETIKQKILDVIYCHFLTNRFSFGTQ